MVMKIEKRLRRMEDRFEGGDEGDGDRRAIGQLTAVETRSMLYLLQVGDRELIKVERKVLELIMAEMERIKEWGFTRPEFHEIKGCWKPPYKIMRCTYCSGGFKVTPSGDFRPGISPGPYGEGPQPRDMED